MEVTGQQAWAVVRPEVLRRGPCKVLKRLIDDCAIDPEGGDEASSTRWWLSD